MPVQTLAYSKFNTKANLLRPVTFRSSTVLLILSVWLKLRNYLTHLTKTKTGQEVHVYVSPSKKLTPVSADQLYIHHGSWVLSQDLEVTNKLILGSTKNIIPNVDDEYAKLL